MKKQGTRFFILGTLIMSSTLVISTNVSAITRTVFRENISVGGVYLITLRGNSEKSVENRKNILEDRLIDILADSNLQSSDVSVAKLHSDYAIYVKRRLLVTVTPQDSAYNQTTPEKQANTWREQLAKSLPQVKVLDPNAH